MKTRFRSGLLSNLLGITAALVMNACSTTQDAAVKTDFAKVQTTLDKINAMALEDLESPAGQQLIIDAASASAGGFIAASTGQEGIAAADAIAGAITAVHDVGALPSVSGTQLQTAVGNGAGATANAAKLATSVSSLYTAVRGKGVPQKSALSAITTGLQNAQPKTATAPATTAAH